MVGNFNKVEWTNSIECVKFQIRTETARELPPKPSIWKKARTQQWDVYTDVDDKCMNQLFQPTYLLNSNQTD